MTKEIHYQKRPRMWLQPLFIKSYKHQKVRLSSHTNSPFKWVKMCLTDPLNQTRGPSKKLKGHVPQPSQVEKGLSSKDLYTWLLSNGVNLTEIHRRPTKFLRKWCWQKHCWFRLKGTEYRMKGGCQTLKILLEGNREDKTKWPTYAAFHAKGRMTRRNEANYRGGKALLSLQVPSYPPHLVAPSKFCYCMICLPVPGPFLTGYHHLNSPPKHPTLLYPPCLLPPTPIPYLP